MFDYDQLISRLKGKNLSTDVSVNSLSNEEVWNNRQTILAINDATKMCGWLGITLQGHKDASSYHLGISQLLLMKEILSISLIMQLEMVIKFSKTIYKAAVNLKLISQQIPKMIYWNVVTGGLLKEVKVSNILLLFLTKLQTY